MSERDQASLRLQALREWVSPNLELLFRCLHDQYLWTQETVAFTTKELADGAGFASQEMMVAFALRKVQILSKLCGDRQLSRKYSEVAVVTGAQLESLLFVIQDRLRSVVPPAQGFSSEEHIQRVSQTMGMVRGLIRWCLSRHVAAEPQSVEALIADAAAQHARIRPERPKPLAVTALGAVLTELAAGLGSTFDLHGLTVLLNIDSVEAVLGDYLIRDQGSNQVVVANVPVIGELDPTENPSFFAIMLLRKLALLTLMTQPGVPTLARFLLPYLADAHNSLLELSSALIAHRKSSGIYVPVEVLQLHSDYQRKAKYLASAARGILEVMRDVPDGLDGDILLT